MKTTLKTTLAAAIIVSLALCMAAACKGSGGGGNDPKSLAKQSYAMYLEAIKLKEKGETSGPNYDAYVKKTEEINAKVEQLSEEAQEEWEAEFLRLMETGKGN